MTQGAYSAVAEVQANSCEKAKLRAVTRPLITLVRGKPKYLVYPLQEDRGSLDRVGIDRCAEVTVTSV